MAILGISFPFRPGVASFPATAEDAEVINDNIQRVLQTRKGERPMRPESGSDIPLFVFENTGALLNARISHEVRRALSAGEPRAAVRAVFINEFKDDKGDTVVDVVVEWEFREDVRSTTVLFRRTQP